MNEQRGIIYEERRHVLDGDNIRDSIFHMMNDYIENVVDMVVSPDQDYDEMESDRTEPDDPQYDSDGNDYEEDVKDISPEGAETYMLKERAAKVYEAKESEFPEPEYA